MGNRLHSSQSTLVWKWPVVKYKHIKIKQRICILFILCLTLTVNANWFKQNIIVIKQNVLGCHLSVKQNLLLFVQPRWQTDRQATLHLYHQGTACSRLRGVHRCSHRSRCRCLRHSSRWYNDWPRERQTHRHTNTHTHPYYVAIGRNAYSKRRHVHRCSRHSRCCRRRSSWHWYSDWQTDRQTNTHTQTTLHL